MGVVFDLSRSWGFRDFVVADFVQELGDDVELLHTQTVEVLPYNARQLI